MSGDAERPAEAICRYRHVTRWQIATLSTACPDCKESADAVLASDWLAAHDAEVAARALREAADEVDVYVPGACQTCEGNVVTACEIWLRARADRVAGHAQEDE